MYIWKFPSSVQLDNARVSAAIEWGLIRYKIKHKRRNSKKHPQTPMCYYYVNMLMTTFLTTFQRFSEVIWRLHEVSKNSRRLPKIIDGFRRLSVSDLEKVSDYEWHEQLIHSLLDLDNEKVNTETCITDNILLFTSYLHMTLQLKLTCL